jgi:hypothetical protein
MMPDHTPRQAVRLTETENALAAALIESARSVPSIHPDLIKGYRDTMPALPSAADPVLQPDRRIFPQWATGIALAGPALGATTVGMGYGARMFFESITTQGIVLVGVASAGATIAVGACAGLVSKLKTPPPPVNHFNGSTTIDNRQQVMNTNKALSFNRTKIKGEK